MSHYTTYYHYLPVTDDAMRWGIYVTGAGRGVMPAGQEYPPNPPDDHPSLYHFDWRCGRTLPEFQVILISDGQGVFESTPTGERAVEPGTLLFLFPDIWHCYRPDRESGWNERWLSFNGELAHRLMAQGLIRAESAVGYLRNRAEAERVFDELLDRIHGKPTQNSILLSLHVMTLLATLIEAATYLESATTSPDASLAEITDPAVTAAIEFIWTRSHQTLSVLEIARALDVNRRTLERRFRAVRGYSILEEINACRLSRAKRLLLETELPIKVVTRLAGFTSEERMRVAFVQRESLSPTAYRSRNGEPVSFPRNLVPR